MFDSPVQEGTIMQNPTFRFSGAYAYDAMRQLALALAQAGFYQDPVSSETRVQDARNHISTLVAVNEKQDHVLNRTLGIIEKMVSDENA